MSGKAFERAIKKRYLQVMRTAIAEHWLDPKTKTPVKNRRTFAFALDMVPQQIYHIETGKDRFVTMEMLHNLCKTFGVNANFVVTGTGAMKLDEQEDITARLSRLEKQLSK